MCIAYCFFEGFSVKWVTFSSGPVILQVGMWVSCVKYLSDWQSGQFDSPCQSKGVYSNRRRHPCGIYLGPKVIKQTAFCKVWGCHRTTLFCSIYTDLNIMQLAGSTDHIQDLQTTYNILVKIDWMEMTKNGIQDSTDPTMYYSL